MMISVFYSKVENNLEKGENAGFQHFLSFLECLTNLNFQGRET